MDQSAREVAVREALALALERDLAADEEPSRESTPDWDSLHHISFIFALEDALDVTLPESALEEIVDIPSALAALEEALDESTAGGGA